MTEHHDGHDRNPEDTHNQRGEDAHTYDVAYKASTHAVNDAFQRLGIDHENWQETQKDTAFLRKLRENCDNMTKWVGRGVITILLGALAAVIWAGVKLKMGK